MSNKNNPNLTEMNCPRYCMNPCEKCVQESKQLAKWLEELKAIKSDGFTDDLLNMGFTKGYNKALDDFVKFASDMPTVETEDGTIRPMWLEEIAEQLKGSASCVSNDMCEWELKNVCYTTSIKHYYSLPTSIIKTFNNCPYCGKKIKVVE